MRRWIDTARLLGRAGSLPVTAALLVSTAFGLAPVAFMVGMAVLLSRVPAVARGEAAFGAAAALTLATLAAQQLLGPMQAALGEHVTENFLAAKREEWREYITQVTRWELDEYLAKY